MDAAVFVDVVRRSRRSRVVSSIGAWLRASKGRKKQGVLRSAVGSHVDAGQRHSAEEVDVPA
jgi:hypothetical protein